MKSYTDLYTYKAQVVRVIDGDTIVADVDLGFFTWRHSETLRLARIDAPERHTETREAGDRAKLHLQLLLSKRDEFVIETMRDERDGFKRYIAEIWLDDQNISDLMVAAGHAIYRSY